jgi:hypothetical protein
MNENKHNPDNKPIRFINSEYQTLFTIPDGGYININKENGEILTRKCRYHGETHLEVGTNIYHICEFAEICERNGHSYEPCPTPEIVAGYVITDRMPVGDKVFALAQFVTGDSPVGAVQKYVTWQGRNDRPGWDAGHYWNQRSDALMDYFNRHDAERSGRVYDHTRLQKQAKSREEAR